MGRKKYDPAGRRGKSRASRGAPCIWMEAGVVNFKICDMNYDCRSCPFDKAMSAAVHKDTAKFTSWRFKLLSEGAYRERPCRHALSGEMPARLCDRNYDCASCGYDQNLESQALTGDFRQPEVIDAGGVTVAEDTHTHPGHTWARVEYGGLVRLGVDDFVCRLLGPLDQMRPPRLGIELEAGAPAWFGYRGANEAVFASPASGIVMAVNGRIKGDPVTVHEDPFGAGWVAVILPRKLKKELKLLMEPEETRRWLAMESMRLQRMVLGHRDLRLAATGGEMIHDVYGNMAGLDWRELVRAFLGKPRRGRGE